MDELLDKIKHQVKNLLEKHQELKQAHHAAQTNQSKLIHEKRLLQEKHQIAISQIEKMLARLKQLEKT